MEICGPEEWSEAVMTTNSSRKGCLWFPVTWRGTTHWWEGWRGREDNDAALMREVIRLTSALMGYAVPLPLWFYNLNFANQIFKTSHVYVALLILINEENNERSGYCWFQAALNTFLLHNDKLEIHLPTFKFKKLLKLWSQIPISQQAWPRRTMWWLA